MNKFTLGLRAKISLITIIILFITIGINTITSSYYFINEYSKLLREKISVVGLNLKFQLEKILNLEIKVDELIGFENQCRSITDLYKDISFAMVLDIKGKILFHNKYSLIGSRISDRNFNNNLLSNSQVFYNIYLDKKKYYYIIIPVYNSQNQHVAGISIFFPDNIIKNKIRKLIVYSSFTSIFSLLIAVILLFPALYIWVTKPLKKLINIIQIIRTKKNLSKRVNINSNDEIGQLSSAFNKMTMELYDTTVSKDYVDSIIKNMIDSLIVLDSNKNIKLVSQSSCRLLKYEPEELIDKSFPLIIKSTDLNFNTDKIMKLIEEDKIKNIELFYICKTGEKIPVQFSSTIIKNKNNSTFSIICAAKDITEQKKSALYIENLNKELIESSRLAGMAEISIGLMHNIGNILNTVIISSISIKNIINESKISGLLKANILFLKNKNDLINFFKNDPKGDILPDYYIKIGNELQKEFIKIEEESNILLKNIQLIDDVIDMQQEYAKGIFITEKVNIFNVIEDSITLMNKEFLQNNITIKKTYFTDINYFVIIQKQKLLHIFLNIFKNAIDALINNIKENKTIEIEIDKNELDLFIKIKDNGIGIKKENLTKIFNFGFNEKKDGHGFGLHSCANFIKEMNGQIYAESQGMGYGTTLILILPYDINNVI